MSHHCGRLSDSRAEGALEKADSICPFKGGLQLLRADRAVSLFERAHSCVSSLVTEQPPPLRRSTRALQAPAARRSPVGPIKPTASAVLSPRRADKSSASLPSHRHRRSQLHSRVAPPHCPQSLGIGVTRRHRRFPVHAAPGFPARLANRLC